MQMTEPFLQKHCNSATLDQTANSADLNFRPRWPLSERNHTRWSRARAREGIADGWGPRGIRYPAIRMGGNGLGATEAGGAG